MFVTSGYIDARCEFWWDELERLLLKPTHLPEKLELELNDEVHIWDLGPAEQQGAVDDRWNVAQKARPTPRQSAYLELHQLLKPMTHDERMEVLRQLARASGSGGGARTSHLPLSWAEAKALGDDELIEIGSHSRTHPQLSARTVTEQRLEIQQSRRDIAEGLDKEAVSFCYPFGSRKDFDARTRQLVHEAGFQRACTGRSDLVTRRFDPYALPRFLIRNWTGDEFARRLKAFFVAT
jgi:peptidoglycan/xylan/chitin deacetylase (PgdA/CDA1 family)